MKRKEVCSIILRGMCALTIGFLSVKASGLDISTGLDGCNVKALHDIGIKGNGVNIAFLSIKHSRTTHEAFYDKDPNGLPMGSSHVQWIDPFGRGVYSTQTHDSALAGIIASRGGYENPDMIGVAPGSDIYSIKLVDTDSTSITPEGTIKALDAALENDCKIVVTGVQLSAKPDGTSFYTMLYDYYAYEYDMLFANPAGNYSNRITTFGDSYNGITTSGLVFHTADTYDKVGKQSNVGTTVDGRKKPDVSAPSQSQLAPTSSGDSSWSNVGSSYGETSWAVPHTAGVAGLLLDYAQSSEDPEDHKNVVIKAVIINSAFPNIKDKYADNTTGLVWHKQRGFGRLDGWRAYDVLSAGKVFPDSDIDKDKGWAYQRLYPDIKHSYTVKATKGSRLVSTLTWNRRVEWQDSGYTDVPNYYKDQIDQAELNVSLANLDMRIYQVSTDVDSTTETLLDAAISELDNVEKLDVLITESGTYRIEISNASAYETAWYALAFEMVAPLVADFNTDYIVNDEDFKYFTGNWLTKQCDPVTGSHQCDIQCDGKVDFLDYQQFIQRLGNYDSRYYAY